jgi:hypothetical protein
MARKKRVGKVTAERPAEPVERAPVSTDPALEQSGDLQGLSDEANADSESVRELVEEGQYFEAAVVSGVENAPPADAGPIRTHERNEDDVPPEYTDRSPDEPKE